MSNSMRVDHSSDSGHTATQHHDGTQVAMDKDYMSRGDWNELHDATVGRSKAMDLPSWNETKGAVNEGKALALPAMKSKLRKK